LAAGTRLGSYEIIGPLGAGGRGEVYRAHDTQLGRDVAIKIAQSPVRADQALGIAMPIADALEAARERGIPARPAVLAVLLVQADLLVQPEAPVDSVAVDPLSHPSLSAAMARTSP
jgi:serine/threonine protein kinase